MKEINPMNSKKINIPEELITSIDLMNTINGGISEPKIGVRQFATHREITIRVPGVSIDNIKIEINNNQLMVYYLLIMTLKGKLFEFPKGLYNKSIPYFVDVNKITAYEQGGRLIIKMPFNELANGQHRDITIKR